jgi:hypothetical protein
MKELCRALRKEQGYTIAFQDGDKIWMIVWGLELMVTPFVNREIDSTHCAIKITGSPRNKSTETFISIPYKTNEEVIQIINDFEEDPERALQVVAMLA